MKNKVLKSFVRNEAIIEDTGINLVFIMFPRLLQPVFSLFVKKKEEKKRVLELIVQSNCG